MVPMLVAVPLCAGTAVAIPGPGDAVKRYLAAPLAERDALLTGASKGGISGDDDKKGNHQIDYIDQESVTHFRASLSKEDLRALKYQFQFRYKEGRSEWTMDMNVFRETDGWRVASPDRWLDGVYAKLGQDRERASDAVARALQTAPDDSAAIGYGVVFYGLLGRQADMERLAAKLAADSPWRNIANGIILEREGNKVEALAAYLKALEQERPLLPAMLLDRVLQLGDPDAAPGKAQDAMIKGGLNDPAVAKALALMHVRAGAATAPTLAPLLEKYGAQDCSWRKMVLLASLSQGGCTLGPECQPLPVPDLSDKVLDLLPHAKTPAYRTTRGKVLANRKAVEETADKCSGPVAALLRWATHGQYAVPLEQEWGVKKLTRNSYTGVFDAHLGGDKVSSTGLEAAVYLGLVQRNELRPWLLFSGVRESQGDEPPGLWVLDPGRNPMMEMGHLPHPGKGTCAGRRGREVVVSESHAYWGDCTGSGGDAVLLLGRVRTGSHEPWTEERWLYTPNGESLVRGSPGTVVTAASVKAAIQGGLCKEIHGAEFSVGECDAD